MTKLQEITPTTEQDVSDVQLKALGLEQITAWKKSGTPTEKQKNAVRQKRFRQEAAKCQSALKIDPPSASKIDPPQAIFFSY